MAAAEPSHFFIWTGRGTGFEAVNLPRSFLARAFGLVTAANP